MREIEKKEARNAAVIVVDEKKRARAEKAKENKRKKARAHFGGFEIYRPQY